MRFNHQILMEERIEKKVLSGNNAKAHCAMSKPCFVWEHKETAASCRGSRRTLQTAPIRGHRMATTTLSSLIGECIEHITDFFQDFL